MKIFVQGQGTVTLGERDFLAQGGEASLYVRGDVAYKIYSDPARALAVSKIAELSAIDDPRVIKPDALVLESARRRSIGFTMRYLHDSYTLCQLFARAFRDRHGITPAMSVALVRELAARVRSVHRAGALIVDLNEMNFLVDRSFSSVHAIDVDSYMTPHHPATALSPNVRDPLVRGSDFSELSDWYAFAVVSFQLLIGVHPFKGTHPTVQRLSERMRRGLSVLRPDVKMPPVAYPLSHIPPELARWYRSLFEDGKRSEPPRSISPPDIKVVPIVLGSAADLTIDLLWELEEPIMRALGSRAGLWMSCANGIYLDGRRMAPAFRGAMALTARSDRPMLVSLAPSGSVELYDALGRLRIETGLVAEALSECDGRIHLKCGDKLLELVLHEVGASVVATTRLAAPVHAHATHLGDGVAVQSLLGATYLSILTRGMHRQLRVPELDKSRVVHARAQGDVVVLLVESAAQYRRLVMRIAPSGESYDVREEPASAASNVDFVVLESGLCVSRRDDGDLELFSTRVGSQSMRICDGKALGDGRLGQHQGKVLCFRGARVYRIATT